MFRDALACGVRRPRNTSVYTVAGGFLILSPSKKALLASERFYDASSTKMIHMLCLRAIHSASEIWHIAVNVGLDQNRFQDSWQLRPDNTEI